MKKKLFVILGKIQKIRNMPQDEILFRIKGMLLEFFEYIQFRLNLNELSDERFSRAITFPKSKLNLDEHIYSLFHGGVRDRFFTEFYGKEARLKMIEEFFRRSYWMSEANQILEGNLTLLGHSVKIPQAGEWHIDPIVNKEWPKVFYSHVKKKNQIQDGDIKYIWELNRHQYLIVLGKAYWITGDEKYAEKVVSTIKNWIETNPYNEGVNWTSSLELAVRSISWIWAYFFCLDSTKHMTEEFHKIIAKSIYAHAKYIETHLSYYSSPYNHLVGEAAALHVIGSIFTFFKSSKKWKRLGWSILTENVDKQFHDDGMSVEQASFYHHFTLGFYLQSVFLRRNNNKNIPEKVLRKIERALEFSMYLTKPDETLPMVGDIDNARSLYFSTKHTWDFRGFLSLGAVLFNRPDFKYQSNGYSEELIWLGTENVIEHFEGMEATLPSVASIPFFKSGYFISRDSWNRDSNYLCFDCGEIAAGLSKKAVPSAAHGHADALSFELVVHGKSFIVDSGFYTYFGELDWHKYFRHEESHNTVLVNSCRQAEYCGRLTWRNVKSPKLKQWESSEHYDAVAGCISYNEDVSHIRQLITIKKHLWCLRDVVKTSRKEDRVHSFLHFDPEVDLVTEKETIGLIASRGNVGLLIKYFGNADVQIDKGGYCPSAGWVAHGYGIKLPAWRAQFAWKTSNSMSSSAMLMIPFNLNCDSVIFQDISCVEDGLGPTIAFKKNEINYSVKMDNHDHTYVSIDQNEFDVSFPKPDKL